MLKVGIGFLVIAMPLSLYSTYATDGITSAITWLTIWIFAGISGLIIGHIGAKI